MTSFPKIFGERRLGPIAALAGLAVFQDRDLSSRHSV